MRECKRCHLNENTIHIADRQLNCMDVKTSTLVHAPGFQTQFQFLVPLCDDCNMNYVNAVLTNELPFSAKGLKAWLARETISDNVTKLPSLAPGLQVGGKRPPAA